MERLVADTGPIVTFARVGRLGLLRDVLPQAVIPPEVLRELTVKGAGKPGAAEVQAGPWPTRQAAPGLTSLVKIRPQLGAGEREALALALELDLPILVDERSAANAARELGLTVVTSLRVLTTAKA